MTDTAADPVADLSARSNLMAADPEIHRQRIAEQVRTTVRAAQPDASGEDGTTDAGHPGRREAGAIAAWLGLAQDGDAVEQMIAAQMVATHDLAMITLGRAMTRAGTSSYFGESLRDASRVLTANLRQIETLARYRTWKMRVDKERALALEAHEPQDPEDLSKEP